MTGRLDGISGRDIHLIPKRCESSVAGRLSNEKWCISVFDSDALK